MLFWDNLSNDVKSKRNSSNVYSNWIRVTFSFKIQNEYN